MNEKTDWGWWEITDEEAERINGGDIEAYNKFFVRNYARIYGLAYNELAKNMPIYSSSKEVADIVNAFYIDLRNTGVKNGRLITHTLHLSALAIDRSTYIIARKLSSENLNYSFRGGHDVQPLEYKVDRNSQDEEKDFYIIDRYQTAQTPSEELETEEKGKAVVTLANALKPFLTDKGRLFVGYYLNGISPRNAERFQNTIGGSGAYRQIEKSLAINYKDVLRVFIGLGYEIPVYLKGQTPDKYMTEIQRKEERERRKQEEQNARECKRREREERARTRKERLREYNREYKRKQRERAKTPVQTSANF